MNFFVKYENQTLLWNTINRYPLFENFKIGNEKEKWFQQIIEQTYINKQNQHKTLQELNRETIANMIQILKTETENTNKKCLENKTFNEIQTDYNKMLSKTIPKEIDFKEKITDEPIHDINDSLEKIKKEREELINVSNISSPPNYNELLVLLKEIKTELIDQKSIIKSYFEKNQPS